MRSELCKIHSTFQSTLPRRERLGDHARYVKDFIFQSTLPRRERLNASADQIMLSDFNPRSHEGSDFKPENSVYQKQRISIHAPTKGATFVKSLTSPKMIISIHAPTKGATIRKRTMSGSSPISIHAPTKGATLRLHYFSLDSKISIHAPTKGATLQNLQKP